MKTLTMLLLASQVSAQALREIPVPPAVDLKVLAEALRAEGFVTLVKTDKEGNKAVVLSQSETKDPQPVIESVTPAADQDMLDLVKEWREGKISAADKDALLLYLVAKVLKAP